MSFCTFGGAGSGYYAIEAVENFLLLPVRNAAAVVLHADCHFFFVRTFCNEEKDRTSGGRVGQGVVQKNMTYLSYSSLIAVTQRQPGFGKTDGEQMSAVGGKRQEVFVGFKEKRLQIRFRYLQGQSVAVCAGEREKLLEHAGHLCAFPCDHLKEGLFHRRRRLRE